jgi:hypothetical protein
MWTNMVHNLLGRPAMTLSRGLHRIGVVALALAAALATGACGSDAAVPDAPPGEPTLAAIRADIFNGTCALSNCHAPPMLAAKLDLRDDGICQRLVSHKSCLFPNKVLVVPGKPEASFLLNKLHGTGLDGTPDPACGASNERMPLGQVPLSGGKLAQIEDWIRAGAGCGGDVPSDAGTDAAAESLADVLSITAVATTIHVGEQTQVTVTLTHGAPTGGQPIRFDFLDTDDGNVLHVPAASMDLDQGVSMVTFAVLGQAVGSVTLTASSGRNSMQLPITVIP